MKAPTPKSRLMEKYGLSSVSSDREAFAEFLRAEGYTEATVKVTTGALGTLIDFAKEDRPLPERYIPFAQRALRWIVAGGKATKSLEAWLHEAFPDGPPPASPQAASPKAEAFSAREWAIVRGALLMDEGEHALEALAVKVLVGTGLRIGMVLDTRVRDLPSSASVDADFASIVEGELKKQPPDKTLRQIMSPVSASRGPYVRIYNYVSKLSERVNIPFDLNTISRTTWQVKKGERA